MRIAAQPPFERYSVYRNFKKAEQRHYVTMVHRETGVHRIMSYGRYLLAVKLGRELAAEEEADHVDGDRANDHPDNLQSLAGPENRRKSFRERGLAAKSTSLVCPQCGIQFHHAESYVAQRRREGRVVIFCSRKCSGLHSTPKRKWRPIKRV